MAGGPGGTRAGILPSFNYVLVEKFWTARQSGRDRYVPQGGQLTASSPVSFPCATIVWLRPEAVDLCYDVIVF